MRRSSISGVNKLRKTLRRLEPGVVDQVRGAIKDSAQAITADAIQLAPVDEGDLVRSIDFKLGRDGLTAVIGPGANAAEIARRKAGSPFTAASRSIPLSRANKALLFQFFKGYWIEFGTKGGGGVERQPPRPFMRPAFQVNRRYAERRVQSAVRNALEVAARG